jgi:hypothetical protein
MPQILPGVKDNAILINNKIDNDSEDSIPFVRPSMNANVNEFDNNSTANVFIFASFGDKRTSFLYSDLTGFFLLCSLKGMCVSW